jgi:hypothetical protein
MFERFKRERTGTGAFPLVPVLGGVRKYGDLER